MEAKFGHLLNLRLEGEAKFGHLPNLRLAGEVKIWAPIEFEVTIWPGHIQNKGTAGGYKAGAVFVFSFPLLVNKVPPPPKF